MRVKPVLFVKVLLILIIYVFKNPIDPLPKVYAQAEPLTPLGPHCIRGGPLPLSDPTFCGCTWGPVYYRGRPVVGAEVALQYSAQMTQTLTQKDEAEIFPFYVTNGVKLGAKRGDVMTVKTEFAGQTVTRPFRALPDSEGEQQVTLVLPEQGTWTTWLTGGYARSLLVDGATLWAGGLAGLLAINTSNQISTTQSLPWSDPAVVGLALGGNHHVWAIGSHNLAEFDGAQWQNRAAPFTAELRALMVHPTTGALWLGGGNSTGGLAVHDGAWHTITQIEKPVMSLVVDRIGNVWVGTSGGGLYRHAGEVADLNSGWTQFRTNDGLASDYVISAVASGNQVWFGTRPLITEQGNLGGISRYNLADNSWQTYTTANGLPADAHLNQVTAPILSLAVDAQGAPWAGTPDGVYRLATSVRWVQDFTTNGDPVQALVTGNNLVGAGQASGQINYLDLKVTPGNPPSAQIALPIPTITQVGTSILTANAMDQDENANSNNPQILAWDWRLDGDTLLCTTAVCPISGQGLSPGVHTINLRVQDDEGVWSALATAQLTVTQGAQVYLPLVNRAVSVQRKPMQQCNLIYTRC